MSLDVLGEVGDPSAKPGSREWALAVRLDIQAQLTSWESDVTHAKGFIALMVQHEGWRVLTDRRGQPFAAFSAFCKERQPYGLGYDPIVIEALAGAKDGLAVGAVLGKHGGDRRSEKVRTDQGGIATLKDSAKNTVEHVVARLDRDRPELAAKVRAGEMSAHAAAIEAGFRKKRPPLESVQRAIERLSDDDFDTFCDWFDSYRDDEPTAD